VARKKKLLWTGIAAGLAVALYFLVRPPAPKHNFDRTSFEKINKGMTLAEVEAILGGPPGDYTTRPTISECDVGWGPGEKEWVSDEGAISVWFDPEGRILGASFSPVFLRTDLTWLERLQMWLGWREKTERVPGQEPLGTNW
jgi:hypothetical protein